MFKRIGQRIRRVRMDHDMKQKELARKIGISQGALTNFELGRRKISLEWLVKIARSLDVPVAFLLGDLDGAAGGKPRLAPQERRLVRAFRTLDNDAQLQRALLVALERMGRHLERAGRRRA